MAVYERLRDFIGTEDIYAYCPNINCRHNVKLDLPALLSAHGNLTLTELRAKLRCSACGSKNVSISLVYTGGMGLKDN